MWFFDCVLLCNHLCSKLLNQLSSVSKTIFLFLHYLVKLRRQLWEMRVTIVEVIQDWMKFFDSFGESRASLLPLLLFTFFILLFLSLLLSSLYPSLRWESVYRKVEVKRSATKLTGNLESCLKLVAASAAAGYIRIDSSSQSLSSFQMNDWKLWTFARSTASSVCSTRWDKLKFCVPFPKSCCFFPFTYYLTSPSTTAQHVAFEQYLLLSPSLLNTQIVLWISRWPGY